MYEIFKRCGVWLLLFAVFQFWSLPAHPATERWVARHLTARDGLPVSSAANAVPGSNGFLWIATHDGLARFDGLQFRIYDATTIPGLLTNRFIQLAKGPDGRIYSLTQDGLLIAAHGDTVERVVLDPAFPDAPLTYLMFDPLCASTLHGLYCADHQGRFKQQLALDPVQGVTVALPAGPGRYWLLVNGKGVWLQDGPARRQVSQQVPDTFRLTVPQLAVNPRDGTLTFSSGHGVVELKTDGSERTFALPHPDHLVIFQIAQRPDRVLISSNAGFFALQDEQLAPASTLGMKDHGPLRFQWRGNGDDQWVSIGPTLFHKGEKVFSAKGTIIHVSEDGSGSLWVSTLGDGVFELSRPRVNVLSHRDGLVSNNVYGVSAAPDGSVWIGQLNGGLQALHPDGNLQTYYQNPDIPGPNPWDVMAAPDGKVYLAPFDPGLYVKRPDSERFKPMPPITGDRPTTIRSLSIDRQNHLWVGTPNGAASWQGDHWQWQWPTPGKAWVDSIWHARDGSHWIGSRKGLWRMDQGETRRIAPELLTNGIMIRDIFEDSRGDFWVCTVSHGLIRIRPRAGAHYEVLPLGRPQGLPSNSPHAVLEDAAGNLWVNSNRGIFRLQQAEVDDYAEGRVSSLAPLVLGLSDGLDELEGNGGVQPAAARSADGSFWFPTQRGLVHFNPATLKLRRNVPRPYLEKLVADGKAMPTIQAALPRGVQTLEIRYSAIALHAGDAVRFRYRLLPGQQRWVDVGTQRVASLTSLAPGRHTFELIASNSDGVWSSQPLELPLQIRPHWFETRVFRLAVIVSIALLSFILFRRRNRLLQIRADVLDHQVRQRTEELRRETGKLETALDQLGDANQNLLRAHAEIEQSNHELSEQTRKLEAMDSFRTRLLADISHELRTPLTLVTLVLQELNDSSRNLGTAARKKAENSLRQADRLNTMVKQLIELARADAAQVVLAKVPIDLPEFVEKLLEDLRPLTRETGIALHFVSGVREQWVNADPERLTVVLSNLVVNACKHAPEGSTVDVRINVTATPPMARIEVTDRGSGFAPEVAEHLFKRYYTGNPAAPGIREGLGIGLALAQELTELHGGRIGARSEPGLDTTFWIELPGCEKPSVRPARSEIAASAGPAQGAAATAAAGTTPGSAANAPPVQATRGPAVRQILIVEDHADLAEYLHDKLSDWVEVVTASNGVQARNRFRQRLPDLLLTDLRLPDTTGLELIAELRPQARARHLPVVLMSAQPRPDEIDAIAGPVEFLGKPFSLSDLQTAMARVWPLSLSLIKTLKAEEEPPQDPLLELARNNLADSTFVIARWATLAHLSERQLRRRIIELTGVAPLTWLREQRLRRVHHLVTTGKCRTLIEAGAQSGMESASHLYRLYRERFGEH